MTTEIQATIDSGNSLIGQWRLLSFEVETQGTGVREKPFGDQPNGRLVLTPTGYMIAVLTQAGRSIPKTADQRSEAFQTTIAYSGRFDVEDDHIKIKVDITWNEAWANTTQIRFFEFENARLHLISAWAPSIFDANMNVRGILVWEREV